MVAQARRLPQYRLCIAGLRLALAGVLSCGAAAVICQLDHPVAASAVAAIGSAVSIYGLQLSVRAIRAVLAAHHDLTVTTIAGTAVRDLLRAAGSGDHG
ncbi:hypothetical protein HDA40_002116 [Hamadaea flava]|uniref:Holin n=1 Tax=Hamadaea flava TaxID=1742688 RepID=A0ABV8LKL6_9ACTN|nr:hypothetical protein [Hamadaea flava]MCP2323609.1 hypothetical protein [Hamadaea flava]